MKEVSPGPPSRTFKGGILGNMGKLMRCIKELSLRAKAVAASSRGPSHSLYEGARREASQKKFPPDPLSRTFKGGILSKKGAALVSGS